MTYFVARRVVAGCEARGSIPVAAQIFAQILLCNQDYDMYVVLCYVITT